MAELDSEGELTRSDVATFLHEFADELEDEDRGMDRDVNERELGDQERADRIIEEVDERTEDDDAFDHDDQPRREKFADDAVDAKRITLIVGGDSATVSVPPTVEFDVEVESRSPMLSSGVSQGIEFDLSWKIDNPDDLDEEWLEVE